MKTKKRKKNFELPKKKLLGATSARCNLLLRSVALVAVVVWVWGAEAAAIAQAGKKLLDQIHCQNGNVLEWGIIYAFK